ncbi:MAG: Multifunctional conjugation protein TraI [Smithella sp. PtaU1.Bin162]|nr:MAG: Multifunctional conjugation protein TraI [Smithella sp. PtaU1.Bin162]
MMGPVTQSATAASKYYYEKDPICDKDNSRWLGGGCEFLGLEVGTVVLKDDFNNIINGNDLTGRQIVQDTYAAAGRTEHRAGVDFVFSDPKSVSIMEHLAKDERIRNIRSGAIEDVVRHIDDNYIAYRETVNYQVNVVHATGKGIFSTYEHSTSRENDPNSHTHVLICNMVQRNDGSYRALYNDDIFKNQKEITAVYNASMAKGLSEIGYAIEIKPNGLYEVAGVPKELMDTFSKRTANIKQAEAEYLDNNNIPKTNPKIQVIATLETRPEKSDLTKKYLLDSWNKQACDIGYPQDKLASLVAAAFNNKIVNDISVNSVIRHVVNDLTATESTFTTSELMKHSLALSLGKYNKNDITKEIAKNAVTDRLFTEIAPGIHSTDKMIETEKDILWMLEAGKGNVDPLMSKEEAQSFITAFEKDNNNIAPHGLTRDQRNLFIDVMTSPDQFIVIQGDAGTGKTTIFKAVAAACEEKNVTLTGHSKTGKAVEEFVSATGARGITVDSFLLHKSEESGTSLRIIDEASMLGSLQTHSMMERAVTDDARLILLGDMKQLQAIDAGRAFQDAQEKGDIHVVKLAQSIRQKNAYTIKLAELTKSKYKINDAVNLINENNKLYERISFNDRRDIILELYKNDPSNSIVVTSTNKEKDVLNSDIRSYLVNNNAIDSNGFFFKTQAPISLVGIAKRFSSHYEIDNTIHIKKSFQGIESGTSGKITSIDLNNNKITATMDDGSMQKIDMFKNGDKISGSADTIKEFAQGDHIMFLKNDKLIGVNNGQTGTINSIDESGIINVSVGKNRINVNLNHYNYVDHAYAITDYKSQGGSYSKVIFSALANRVNLNSFYVAATRAKDDFYLLTDDIDQLKKYASLPQDKKSTLDHTIQTDEIINGINIYSKVEKDINNSQQQKDLSRMEKDRYATEQMPQHSNSFESGIEI